MSTTRFLIAFLTFLAVARMTESLCCDEIKSEIRRKTKIFEILCSKRSRRFPNCCKGLNEEIDNYKMAYKELCIETCTKPKALGMESGSIPDSSLTASSMFSSAWGPQYSRLNGKLEGCAWLAKLGTDPKKSWLQVDFGKQTIVTGVATQGSCNHVLWVKSYVIWYSDDAVNWKYYNEEGARKVFQANSDQNTVVTNHFKHAIVAQYVRISARTHSGNFAMRVEYYGCSMEE